MDVETIINAAKRYPMMSEHHVVVVKDCLLYTSALLCLDVTEAILDEAIALGYNLVISHHPLIFKG